MAFDCDDSTKMRPLDRAGRLKRASQQGDHPNGALESNYAPVAQLDRAFASEAKGHKFESCRAHQFSNKFMFSKMPCFYSVAMLALVCAATPGLSARIL